MKDSKLDTPDTTFGRQFARVDEMIGQASGMLEQMIQNQDGSATLHYAKRTLRLCLVRVADKDGLCYSARWAKFFVNQEGKRVWYEGWLPGKVPSSVVQKMDEDEVAWFRDLDRTAKELIRVRKNLTSKKKRIMGTLQSIRQIDAPRLQEMQENLPILQDAEEDVEYF